MEFSIEVLTRVRKFVTGEMTPAESAAFEEILKGNPALTEEVEDTRQLVEAAEQMEYERLFKVVAKVGGDIEQQKNLQTPKKSLYLRYKKIGLIAASILVVLSVGYWWLSPQKSELQSFLAESYIPPINSDELRGNSNENQIRPHIPYENGDYQQSVNLINNFSNTDTLYLHLQLLKGHNYVKLRKYDKAIHVLNLLIEQKENSKNYKQPTWDNVAWVRIMALTYKFMNSPDEKDKSKLKNEIETFLKEANSSDSYYEKGLKLKKLLD